MIERVFHVLRWTRRELDATLAALVSEGAVRELSGREPGGQAQPVCAGREAYLPLRGHKGRAGSGGHLWPGHVGQGRLAHPGHHLHQLHAFALQLAGPVLQAQAFQGFLDQGWRAWGQ